MVNINIPLEDKLKDILPTYLEQFLDDTAKIPCISYSITRNQEMNQGNTVGYSMINARIKIWAKRMEELCSYSESVDNAMAELGHGRFIRSMVGDLNDNDLICRILDYAILLPEQYQYERGI